MRRRKIGWYAIAAAVLLAVSVFLYTESRSRPDPQQHNAATGPMLKFQATREHLTATVEVKGKSAYADETIVYAPFTADVTRWNVTDGAQVKQGDVLFELDDKALRQEIEEGQAALRKMELEMKIKNAQDAADAHVSETSVPATEADAIKRAAQKETRALQRELDELNRAVAESKLTAKREKLAQAKRTAPTDGMFLFVGAKEPKTVREGDPVGKIVGLSKLQMICTVSEFDVFQIKEGMPVDVKIDALKQETIRGAVERVSKFPKTDETSSGSPQFEVVVSLEPKGPLIAGLSMTGTIVTESKEGALVVPTLAVQRGKDQYYVLVESERGIEKRIVKIGLETAEKTEILEGLSEGDTVVLQ